MVAASVRTLSLDAGVTPVLLPPMPSQAWVAQGRFLKQNYYYQYLPRCDCNGAGSQDEFCDQNTGQCECNTLQPTFGRKCDECKPGYWNFPNCQQCECNGHADTCHPQTGVCNDCRDATMGDLCDKCVIGYYGRPEIGPDQVQCRECKCPDTKASGHNFAYQGVCELDPTTLQAMCHCEDGYAGDKCDICDKELKSERTLKVDITNLHMKQATPHPCNICPKTFPSEPDCANTRTTPTNLQNLPVMSVTSDQPESGTH